MMNPFRVLLSFFLSFQVNAFAKDCTYEFDQEKSVVIGTGFKTSKKVGVNGKFFGIKLNKEEKVNDPKKLLDGLEVSVDLVSLDSENSLRDKNLRETLFSNIVGDSVVRVKVMEVTKDKIKTSMNLNEKSQEVVFNYTLEKDTFKAEGVFDALKFALNDQIAALKKRCGSLHTGADGKSVTWTDFNVSVVAPLVKKCK